MPKKISVKKILELNSSGMSGRDIAVALSTSRNSISTVLGIAQSLNLSWDKVKNLEEEKLYQEFFPDKFQQNFNYEEVNYELVHSELKRVGVTLKLLWNDYIIKCKSENKLSCGYTKFCEGYSDYVAKSNATSHIIHKPGVIIEVDWSGPTMKFYNDDTGEELKAYLFVGTMPYSQYSYVEATLSMNQDDWLRCHVNMFNYIGGTTIRLVCDNLKTGVIKHPKDGEIVLNDAYEALGEHYSIAIMPTGVRKPKHKASVEGTVGKIATAIIARLRNQTFYSLNELQLAILKALKAFNDQPFQKREGSRTKIFEEMEKPILRKLPDIPFELSKWDYEHKVGLDCHVIFKTNRYSVPYQYIGKSVDIKYTSRILEVFYNHERIASHPIFAEYTRFKYHTDKSHMPDNLTKTEWNTTRIEAWASKIGPKCSEVIRRILNSVKIKEQAFNSALAVLRLSSKYSSLRLENACEYSLKNISIPRYHHLNAILVNKQDVELQKESTTSKESEGYVRGAGYYGKK